jgi:hypothetical protein
VRGGGLYQRLVGWLYGMSPLLFQGLANNQVLFSFRFLVSFSVSVSSYIYSAYFCFLLYMLSLYLQIVYCLAVVHVSAPVFIFRFYVYLSPN